MQTISILVQTCSSADFRTINRVATVREKVLEKKNVPGQGKVREFHFQSGKFRKNEKSQGKVREFQKIKKKLLVNWLLVFH